MNREEAINIMNEIKIFFTSITQKKIDTIIELLESDPEPMEYNLSDEFVQALIDDVNQSSRLKQMPNKFIIELLTNRVWGKISLMTFESNLLDEAIDRLNEIDRLTAENEELKEKPRPENREIYTCKCGWHGTLDEMDAAGSKDGCCPRCGNEELPTIEELQAELKAKDNRIKELKKILKDMYKNIYGLYHKDALSCHGTWPTYKHIPQLIQRIEEEVLKKENNG